MAKNEIQEQRMKGYFIEATKEILKSEGLKSLSVRTIAEQAGYSFGTLYNYFKDVKDLIFFCVEDFRKECMEQAKKQAKKQESGKPKIKALTESYIKYFVQYPGIFDLFFLEKMSDIGSSNEASGLITSLLEDLCAEEWAYCIQQKMVTDDKAQIMKTTLSNMVTGTLLLYMNRRFPGSFQEFQQMISKQIDFILDCLSEK